MVRGGCEESELISALKNAGLATDQERLDEYADRFLEHIEHIQEVFHINLFDLLKKQILTVNQNILALNWFILKKKCYFFLHYEKFYERDYNSIIYIYKVI